MKEVELLSIVSELWTLDLTLFYFIYLFFSFLFLFSFILDLGKGCDVTSHVMVTYVTITVYITYDIEEIIEGSGIGNII